MRLLKFLKKEWLILIFLMVPVVHLLMAIADALGHLPFQWDLKTRIDAYKLGFLWPLISIGIYLLMIIIPKIDPRKGNYNLFSITYYKFRLIIVLFLSAISAFLIVKSLGYLINERLMFVVLAIVLTALGNYLPMVQPNWLLGICLPWTLKSDKVWRKTHYFGGQLQFWLGLALLIPSWFLPKGWLSELFIVTILASVLIIIGYAYLIFQKEQNEIS